MSKNKHMCMYKEGWCVGLRQKEGSLSEDVWNTLKGDGIGKRGVKTKILKRWVEGWGRGKLS